MSMYKIGITGGIGAGKSSVAKVISAVTGYPLYIADARAKELVEQNIPLRTAVVKEFGSKILLPGGQLDRSALGKIVFNDPDKLKILNNIIHPITLEDFNQWCLELCNSSHPPKGVIKEAAILFESGTHTNLDIILYIYAPIEIRIKRAIKRDGKIRSDIIDRMKNQWTDEKKMALSDWIIRNYEPHFSFDQLYRIPDILRNAFKNRNMKLF